MSMSFAKWLKGHVDCIKTIPSLTHKIAKDSVSDKEDFDTWLGAFDAETDPAKKQHWITTSNGQHVLIDGEGNVQAGMGGKFNGQKITEAHTSGAKKTAAKKPSAEKLAEKPTESDVKARAKNLIERLKHVPPSKWTRAQKLPKLLENIKEFPTEGSVRVLEKLLDDYDVMNKEHRQAKQEIEAKGDRAKEWEWRAYEHDGQRLHELIDDIGHRAANLHLEISAAQAKERDKSAQNAQKPSANTRANGKPLDGLESVYEKYGESINKQYNKWKAELDAKGVKLTDKEEDLLEDFARHAGGMKQDLDKLWQEQREAIKSKDRKLFDSYEDMRHGLEDSLERVTNRANDFLRKKLFGGSAQKPADVRSRANSLKEKLSKIPDLSFSRAKDLIKQLDSAESFPNEQRTRYLERLLDGYEKLNEGHNRALKEMMAKGSSAKEWEKRAFEQDSQKLRDLTDQISKQAATLSLEMNKAPKRN